MNTFIHIADCFPYVLAWIGIILVLGISGSGRHSTV